jgi:hypothetical protein
LRNRKQEQIREKGFAMTPRPKVIESYTTEADLEELNAIDFARLRVGL